MKKLKGFTLIELLIVVAIIGILAAIAIPNFLAAQTRSKVARAEAEMRQVATALETYYIDNNVYPQGSLWAIPNGVPRTGPAAGDPTVTNCDLPVRLTTPVAHLSSLPTDPFNQTGKGSYGYASRVLTCWILHSSGPDNTETDIASIETNFVAGCVQTTLLPAGGAVLYDPTNGTTSVGTIVRTGP